MLPLLRSLYDEGLIDSDFTQSFLSGLTHYCRTGITPHYTYVQSRSLYCLSRGRYALHAKAAFSVLYPAAASQEPPLDPSVNPPYSDLFAILKNTGYLILPSYFCTSLVDEIAELLDRASHPDLLAPPPATLARYFLDGRKCLKSKLFQQIIQDKLIFQLVSDYLACEPLIDLVTAWRLMPIDPNSVDLSAEALQYHIDLDRAHFLKVFVYITDVCEDSGPHTFVPRTHLANAPSHIQDRRYMDHEITSLSVDTPLSILGFRGTVIIADTHCLHKGTLPVRSHRDIFQVEFCSSLFGAPYGKDILGLNQDIFRDVASS